MEDAKTLAGEQFFSYWLLKTENKTPKQNKQKNTPQLKWYLFHFVCSSKMILSVLLRIGNIELKQIKCLFI